MLAPNNSILNIFLLKSHLVRCPGVFEETTHCGLEDTATASYRALRRNKNYLSLVRLLQTSNRTTMFCKYSEWLAL